MRNSHNITLTNNDSLTEVEDTTWSLPGAVVGFLSWLCALAIPMLIYGSNTLLFFIYTWPFFLALMPVAVVVGIAPEGSPENLVNHYHIGIPLL